MIRLEFKVNLIYLLLHTLRSASGDKPTEAFVRIKDRYEVKHLFGSYDEGFVSLNSFSDFKKSLLETEKLVKMLLDSKQFKQVCKETEKYKQWLEIEWQKNGSRALKYLQDITALSMPAKTITIVVTHPKLNNGVNFPNKNTIAWGHREDWKNYSIVYVCHELLHILTYKKCRDDKLIHALIELATDNELRIRLNNKGKYFSEGKKDIGHPYLRNLEKKILQHWIEYLKTSTDRDILSLEKELSLKSSEKKVNLKS